MEVTLKNEWKDLTLKEFLKIQEIASRPEDSLENSIDMLAVLSNLSREDIKSLPTTEFNRLSKSVKFVYEEAIPNKVRKEYKIHDRRYSCKADLTGISTAQYLDYQTYMKLKPRPGLETFISLWLIPKGHKYNDGYDIEEVKEDILDMPLLDALAIQVFLVKQLVTLILISEDSLKNNLKRMGMSPKKIEEALIPLHNTAFGLWSSVAVSSRTPRWKKYLNGLSNKFSSSRVMQSINNVLKRNK